MDEVDRRSGPAPVNAERAQLSTSSIALLRLDRPDRRNSCDTRELRDLRAVHQPHRYIAVRAVGAPARPYGRGREKSADPRHHARSGRKARLMHEFG